MVKNAAMAFIIGSRLPMIGSPEDRGMVETGAIYVRGLVLGRSAAAATAGPRGRPEASEKDRELPKL